MKSGEIYALHIRSRIASGHVLTRIVGWAELREAQQGTGCQQCARTSDLGLRRCAPQPNLRGHPTKVHPL